MRNIQYSSHDRQRAKQRTPDIRHISAALSGCLLRKVLFEGKSVLNLGMCVTATQFRQQVQLAVGTNRFSGRYRYSIRQFLMLIQRGTKAIPDPDVDISQLGFPGIQWDMNALHILEHTPEDLSTWVPAEYNVRHNNKHSSATYLGIASTTTHPPRSHLYFAHFFSTSALTSKANLRAEASSFRGDLGTTYAIGNSEPSSSE